MTSDVVTLQAVTLSDAEAIFRAWGSSRDNFAYLTAPVFSDVDDAKRYIEGLFQPADSCAFHIVLAGVGIVGIVKAQLMGHRAQVGYVVHRPYCGKGFATSAVRQIVERLEAMPQVSRIWATCALENHGSIRVLEKCGFQREGILRNWVAYPAQGGGVFDNYSYVRIPRA
jgi:RimJ/RimL family protein N-acetyltransferase